MCIKLSEPRNGVDVYECKCDCGNTTYVRKYNLKNGHTTSCGCFHRKRSSEASTTHGYNKRPLYSIYKNMKHRCYDPKTKYYSHYGGRGIKICDRWLNDFYEFERDMGKRPSPKHTIDRIDNDGNYEPSNCRWATRKEQSNNTRWNAYVMLNGKRIRTVEAAKELGITIGGLNWRRRHWGRIVK